MKYITNIIRFVIVLQNIMQKSLKEISQIRLGYFAQSFSDDGVAYLQAKQFDDIGNIISVSDVFISGDPKSNSHMLCDGDVILAGKGNKNFAWCYREKFGPAIASTIFFVIRPDIKKVIPEYLVAMFNHPKSQLYFKQLGAGSNIQSIRKNELEDFNIAVLPLSLQVKVVAMYELHKKNINLTLQLLQHKGELYESAVNTILNNN